MKKSLGVAILSLTLLSSSQSADSYTKSPSKTISQRNTLKTFSQRSSTKNNTADRRTDTDNQPEDTKEEVGSPKSPDETSKEGFSGSVVVANNYVWHGISQTDSNPAVQGEITYSYKGFYVDVFGSNVDFHSFTNEIMEIDPSVGYGHEFKNGLGYDIGIVRYIYPGENRQYDYNDGYLRLNYKIFFALFNYSNDAFATGRSGAYYSGGIDWPIPEKYVFGIKDLSLELCMGYSDLPPQAGNSYSDYAITIKKKIGKQLLFKVTQTWIGGNASLPPLDHPATVLQLIYNF